MASYLNDKLLVVGAGGIGCELLKNLILTGFNQIEIIDLDTIELSNLNRQFLFQKVHVGKPKAVIARESVLKYNPDANLIAHHDSIMNVKYNVEYFKQFSIVLNALDNKAARSHVNRLCLAADVPLIESGSAGYLGQVTMIKKGLTECYDCLPKPAAKSFPGCTIRNTPSEPIHCIVWAKHLFNQLFGAEDPDEAVSPDGEDPENMADAGKVAAEKSREEEAVTRISTRQWAKQTDYDPKKLFNKLFCDDIKYLLSMSKLWEKRTPPKPLDWSECVTTTINDADGTTVTEKENDKPIAHKIWSLNECYAKFSDSVIALYKRIKEEMVLNNEENPILSWDKDDEHAMDFVTAASNFRCFIFSIPLKSKFETKSLAGNIIPAIASTNAIVAGLIVLQALKVLENKLDECRTVYLRDRPIQNKLIVSTQLVKPNSKCYVCAPKPEIVVRLDMQTFTLKQFETKILKKELNMIQPDVEIDDGSGRIIISSEEGETEDNDHKTFSQFGLVDQCSLKCDDFFQNYELRITLAQCDQFADASKDYEVVVDKEMLKEVQENVQKETEKVKQQQQQFTAASVAATSAAAAAQEDVINLDENSNGSTASGDEKKRTYERAFREEDENDNDDVQTSSTVNENVTKKRKSNDNETIPINNNQNNHQNQNNEDVVIEEEVASNSNCSPANSSNSINDASDALSDEDVDEDEDADEDDNEACVQPKLINNNNNNNHHHHHHHHHHNNNHHHHHNNHNHDNQQSNTNHQLQSSGEEILVDDDIIIEENSNDLRNEEEQYNNQHYVNNNNQNIHDEQTSSNDVIECTSEEDIIEINEGTGGESCSTTDQPPHQQQQQPQPPFNGNDDSEHQQRQPESTNGNGVNHHHENHHHHHNHPQNGHENSNSNSNNNINSNLKRLSTIEPNIDQQTQSSEMSSTTMTITTTTIAVTTTTMPAAKKLKQQENDDGITLID